MSNINSALKAMKGPQGPGAFKGIMAALAITWGTRTITTQAMDAAERRDSANAEAETLRLEIESAHELLSERLTDAIRDGYCDPQVKARAAALGWEYGLTPPSDADAGTLAREYGVHHPLSVVDPYDLQDDIDAQRDASAD